MNKVILIFSVLFLSSCFSYSESALEIDSENVSSVEIHTGPPESQVEIKMKNGFESDFIQDLNRVEKFTPVKFAKTHKIMVYYNNETPDMFMTNGSIYWSEGKYYKGTEHLVNKYKE